MVKSSRTFVRSSSVCPPCDPSYGVWLQPGAQRDYPHLSSPDYTVETEAANTEHQTPDMRLCCSYLIPCLLPSLACFQNLCAAAPSSAGQLWVLISFVWTRHASYLISSNLTSSSRFDEWLFILRLWRTLHSDGGLSWEAGFRSDCARRFFNKKYIGTYDREAAQSWDLSQ